MITRDKYLPNCTFDLNIYNSCTFDSSCCNSFIMKNIFIAALLILAGLFGYNYFTSNSTEAETVVVVDNIAETSAQELANNWDDIELPEEIRNYSSIEACDTTEARVCFGSGGRFYKETDDVTVANLISTAETSRYGVQVKKTGELFIFSIANAVSKI